MPPVPPANGRSGAAGWLWALGLLLVAGGGWVWWHRCRKDEPRSARAWSGRPEVSPEERVADDVPLSAAAATPRMLARRDPTPSPLPPGSDRPRAVIELELRPRRAGVNLLTATADMDVIVRNRGAAEALDVRLEARLTSARGDQDAELGRIFSQPGGRLAAPPFALAPGAERSVRAIVTLPRDAINVLTAVGRPMFVPVVTLNARYRLNDDGAGVGQTAQAFALGIERAGAAKLAPFWLDGPARTFEAVAARPHALAISS